MFGRFYLEQLLLLLLVLATTTNTVAAKIVTDCSFSDVVDINNKGLSVQHYVNRIENTITMKVIFDGGWQSWLGVGVSESGLMSPAIAVIGRMLPTTNEPNVQEYDMMNNNKDASGVIPINENDSTLLSSSFVQTDSGSTLEFTKPFDGTTTFIYAVGLKDNQWEGKHKLHGLFTLNEVHECEEIEVIEDDDDQDGDGSSNTAACALTAPIEIAQDLTLEQRRFNDTYTMKLTYTGGKSWIGIGLKGEEGTGDKPPVVVIGQAYNDGTASVDKFIYSAQSDVTFMPQSSQTLIDATFIQTETTSTLTFTKYIDESLDVPAQVVTDDSIWVYAVGSPDNVWSGPHTIHGSFTLDLTPCNTDNPWVINNPSVSDNDVTDGYNDNFLEDFDSNTEMKIVLTSNRVLWMAHGIMMLVSWGLLAPIGIGFAIFGRRRIFRHLFAVTLFFTAVAILLAVLANKIEDNTIFRSSHAKYGLGTFLLLLVQTLLLCGQKDDKDEDELKNLPSTPSTDPEPALSPVKVEFQPFDESIDIVLDELDLEKLPNDEDGQGTVASTMGQPRPPPQSSQARCGAIACPSLLVLSEILWVLVIVSVAWYTCYTGSILTWNEIGYTMINRSFFGCIGGILAFVILLKVLLFIFNKRAADKKEDEMEEKEEDMAKDLASLQSNTPSRSMSISSASPPPPPAAATAAAPDSPPVSPPKQQAASPKEHKNFEVVLDERNLTSFAKDSMIAANESN